MKKKKFVKKKKSTVETIDQSIVDIVRKETPENVDQLLQLVKVKFLVPEEKIIDSILRLQNNGKISLKKPPLPIARKLTEYLRSHHTYWFWTTMSISLVTAIIVLLVPENFYPIVYIRYILGSIFVLWLPGYTFIKALFPKKVPIPTSSSELDTIERMALSIGTSLALVPITGLLLNYTPWGVRTTPVTLGLLTLTLIFATVAVIREHQCARASR